MEQEKTLYQSPEISVVSLAMEGGLLDNSQKDNGEMGNGGFLDE